MKRKAVTDMDRIAKLARKTNETDITMELNLDGSGKYEIDTGIGFLDHMLTGFAKHGFFDLKLKVKGDLEKVADRSSINAVKRRAAPSRIDGAEQGKPPEFWNNSENCSKKCFKKTRFLIFFALQRTPLFFCASAHGISKDAFPLLKTRSRSGATSQKPLQRGAA